MNKVDWSKAPADAEFYAHGEFRKSTRGKKPKVRDVDGEWIDGAFSAKECKLASDYEPRPKQPQTAPESKQEPLNKYSRQIVCLDGKACQIDVYRVLDAFEVDSHPVAHAIKKLLAAGKRHAKTREQDLQEAIASIKAELLMSEQRK